ncbi:hypothetical protein ACEPAI_2666 [Sanghuangporus weigelae]
MDLDNEVIKQVLTELKSYAHVVLPTLLVYAIECRVHLKAWHSVRQRPRIREPPKDDIESSAKNLSESEIRVQQSVANRRVFLKYWLFKFVFTLALASIVMLDQYITIQGWYKPLQNGEEVVGIADADDASGAEADRHGYKWYYNSASGEIDWVKAYYPIALFLPAVCLISRALLQVSGFNRRLILRTSKGTSLMVSGWIDRSMPRCLYPALIKASFALASILLASGALIYQSSICSMILFASMVHFMISDICAKKITLKHFVFGGILILPVMTALFVWFWIYKFSLPICMLLQRPHEGETNWSGFIWGSMILSGPFGYVAIFYRMDDAFALSEERLVGQPDTSMSVRAANDTLQTESYGPRISSCPRSQSTGVSLPDSATPGNRWTRFRCCYRWSKPYFHTAILSWIPVYTLIAYLKVKGYIETDAELTGAYAIYLLPPVMCLAVILRAAVKGPEELKRVWEYKEDWTGTEEVEAEAGADTIVKNVDDAESEGKVLISEKN